MGYILQLDRSAALLFSYLVDRAIFIAVFVTVARRHEALFHSTKQHHLEIFRSDCEDSLVGVNLLTLDEEGNI